ncbi:MAG: M15 family metallopeptidase [Smithellaceae bacterium]
MNRSISISIVVIFFALTGIVVNADANDIEKMFIEAGLIDVSSIDATIQVDLVNSDPQKNYFRENFYGGLNKCYLRKDVATKLSQAQKFLKTNHPELSLQTLDCARPRSVSVKMYEKMKGTKYEKYVANPKTGSMHNYGIAVDVTIADSSGKELDMGFSPFRKSDIEIYWQFAKMKLGKKLTKQQKTNLMLLENTMKSSGFIPLSHEWWHFDGMPKDQARKMYKIIE